jgi:hypothetical protein
MGVFREKHPVQPARFYRHRQFGGRDAAVGRKLNDGETNHGFIRWPEEAQW